MTHHGVYVLQCCRYVNSAFRRLAVTTAQGPAVVQAVSRRLPAETARDGARIKACGVCGGQSDAEVGFVRVLRLSPPIMHSTSFPTVVICHPGLVQ
jgi:hypothetical protein